MARCPDCNRWVPNGEPQVEEEDTELSGEGETIRVTTEVSIVIPCGECGTDLKGTSLEVTGQEDHHCPVINGDDDYLLGFLGILDAEVPQQPGGEFCGECGSDHLVVLREGSVLQTRRGLADETLVCPRCEVDRLRNELEGGPEFEVTETSIEPSERWEGKGRVKVHYYGADVTWTVRCELCGEEVCVTGADDLRASSFEDYV